jgi:Fe-S-cluster containining protein
MGDDTTFGTADPGAPVSRADFERALRHLNMSDLDLRELVLRLAAQVVSLTDELTRRIDRVEPTPAAPSTPAREPAATVEQAVADSIPETLAKIHAAEARTTGRVWIETDQQDKYELDGADVPCAELLHLCQARCCKLTFPLSTFDLDEGVIRWDYGQPYMIRQRASDGYCVHNAPGTHGCTVHAQRPLVCRKYDCRDDVRIWADYEKRVPASPNPPDREDAPFDLMERVKLRAWSRVVETSALVAVYPDDQPRVGPAPAPNARMFPRRT